MATRNSGVNYYRNMNNALSGNYFVAAGIMKALFPAATWNQMADAMYKTNYSSQPIALRGKALGEQLNNLFEILKSDGVPVNKNLVPINQHRQALNNCVNKCIEVSNHLNKNGIQILTQADPRIDVHNYISALGSQFILTSNKLTSHQNSRRSYAFDSRNAPILSASRNGISHYSMMHGRPIIMPQYKNPGTTISNSTLRYYANHFNNYGNSRDKSNILRASISENANNLTVEPGTKMPFSKITQYLTPFASSKNISAIKATMRGRSFSSDCINKGMMVLKHLYDNGIHFTLDTNSYSKTDKYGNLHNYIGLIANLTDVGGNVNILDARNKASFIGSLYTHSGYKLFYSGGSRMRNANPLPLIDYTDGDRIGRIILPRSSKNEYEDQGRHKTRGNMLYLVDKHNNRLKNVPPVYMSPKRQHSYSLNRSALRNSIKSGYGNSADYLKDQISHAYDQYTKLILGANLKNVDNLVARDQDTLNDFIKNSNDLSNDDLMVLKQNYAAAKGTGETKLTPKGKEIQQEAYKLAKSRIGNYDDQFDPNLTIRMNRQISTGNPANKMITALVDDDYLENHPAGFKDNLGNNVGLEDRLLKFDPNNIDLTVDSRPRNHASGRFAGRPMRTDKFKLRALRIVQHDLIAAGIGGSTHYYRNSLRNPLDFAHRNHLMGKPQVSIDKNGIIHWSGYRPAMNHPKFPTKPRRQRRNETRQHFQQRLREYPAKLRRYRYNKRSWFDNSAQKVSGEIGQIFAPDEYNVLHTKFKSGDNFDMVPSYEGYYQYKGLDKNEPRMKRLRVKGYPQMVAERLNRAVDSQVSRHGAGDLSSPRDATSINATYHSELNGTRLQPNWFKYSPLSTNYKLAVLKTLHNKVRFGNGLGETSSTFGRNKYEHDLVNFLVHHHVSNDIVSAVQNNIGGDNASINKYIRQAEDVDSSLKPELDKFNKGFSASMVDNENIRVLIPEFKRTFDMAMTGTGGTQGLVLYMSQGAHVNSDGTIARAPKDSNGRAPIRNTKYFKNAKYNAWDRNMSTANLAMNALNVDDNIQMMLSTFGGRTYDDAIVISKKFAEEHPVHPAVRGHYKIEHGHYDGKGNVVENPNEGLVIDYKNVVRDPSEKKIVDYGSLRPIEIGDKLSDFGFNKFTVGTIVDPKMDDKTAQEEGLSREVHIFQHNPKLQVVASPYSHITRCNAGIAHEMIDAPSSSKHVIYDYDNPNYKEATAQAKENSDPAERAAAEKQAKGKAVIGTSAPVNLIQTDKTADRQSTVPNEQEIEAGKGNKLSNQGVWVLNALGCTKIPKVIFNSNARNVSKLREYMLFTGVDIAPDGSLHRSNGFRDIVPRHANNRAVSGTMTKKEHPGEHRTIFVTDPNDLYLHPERIKNPVERRGAENAIKNGQVVQVKSAKQFLIALGTKGGLLKLPQHMNIRLKSHVLTGMVPIMSAGLRRNRQMVDTQNQINDFNKYYVDMYNKTQEFLNDKTDTERKTTEERMQTSDYNVMANQIISQKLGGIKGERNKNSFIRDHILSKVVHDSAYDVATANPGVPLGEIFVGPKTYHRLTLDKPGHKNDYILVHRDPCLHSGSVRAFKAKLDPNLKGEAFQMNPVDDDIFDGDFDGDHYGLKYISHDKSVQDEMKKIDVAHHLVNYSGPKLTSDLNLTMDFVSGAVASSDIPVKESPFVSYPILKDKDGKAIHDQFGIPVIQKYQTKKTVDGKVKYDKRGIPELLKSDKYKISPRVDHKKNVELFGAKKAKSIEDSWNAKGTSTYHKTSADQLNDYMVHLYNQAVSDHSRISTDKNGKKVTQIDSDAVAKDAMKRTQPVVNSAMHDHNFGAAKMNITNSAEMKKSLGRIVASGAKASPEKLTVFKYFYSQFKNHPAKKAKFDRAIQEANGLKTDLTGVAGAKTQALMSALHDYCPNTVLESTYWATQSVLQIKHDPKKGKKILKILTEDDPNLVNDAESAHMNRAQSRSKKKAGKHITADQYEDQYINMRAKAGVSGNPHITHKIAQAVSSRPGKSYRGKGGQIHREIHQGGKARPIADIEQDFGSPLDIIAYGNDQGGFLGIMNMALSGEGKHMVNGSIENGFPYRTRSISEGKYSGTQVPKAMTDQWHSKDLADTFYYGKEGQHYYYTKKAWKNLYPNATKKQFNDYYDNHPRTYVRDITIDNSTQNRSSVGVRAAQEIKHNMEKHASSDVMTQKETAQWIIGQQFHDGAENSQDSKEHGKDGFSDDNFGPEK